MGGSSTGSAERLSSRLGFREGGGGGVSESRVPSFRAEDLGSGMIWFGYVWVRSKDASRSRGPRHRVQGCLVIRIM